MTPHLWQRQPGEAPADFTAFIACLRLKGRRSLRAVAAQTGRSPGALRRLSAQFNWPARVTAFETRLADASQNALDLLVQSTSARTIADYQRLRMAEFKLAERVLKESCRWLKLASDPRRRDVSLGQVCRVIDLATRLGRLAAGMPTGDQPRQRPCTEDAPGYWTGPFAEEALNKIYGSQSCVDSPPTDAAPPSTADQPIKPDSPSPSGVDQKHAETSTGNPPAAVSNVNPANCNLETATGQPPCQGTGQRPVSEPGYPRRDAWASWARMQRRAATMPR